jgi:hypothetical protein
VRDRANNEQIVRALNDLWAALTGNDEITMLIIRANSTSFALDVDNAGAGGNHITAGGVFLVQDAKVLITTLLQINAGNLIELYNAANSNSVSIEHSETNDVLRVNDGLMALGRIGGGSASAPSTGLHIVKTETGTYVAILDQTGSANGDHGLRVAAASTNAASNVAIFESGGTGRFVIGASGVLTGNGGQPLQIAPQSAAASVSPALTTSYASFSPACSISLSVGNWIVEGTFYFSCGGAGDVNQAAFGKLNVVSGSATIGLSTSEAITFLEVNGNAYMVTRSWPVTVTATAVIELQVKKSGGAGTSTANATHSTILASFDGNPV